MEKTKEKTEKNISAKELLLEAQKFNLRPNEDIFDKGDWIHMFLLPKTEEDIEVLNKLFFVCRPYVDTPSFSKENIGQLIVMEYFLIDDSFDWTHFYNVTEIVKYNTQGKFEVVQVKQ